MSGGLPPGFAVGHWTDEVGRTGCTAVIAPPGARGGVDVRGGGTGTRETEALSPLAGVSEVSAVMLTGGSAFGLACADGAARWLEERGRGHPTPAGPVPIVPAAVVFDLPEGDPRARPGPDAGYAACEAAGEEAPAAGRVGAGTGAAVGKLFGRERACPGGVGFATAMRPGGETIAAIVVVNAFGDVIAADGSVLAGPRDSDGSLLNTVALLSAFGDSEAAEMSARASGENTTLACVVTDAPLSKVGCATVARMASAGIARAVAPAFSPVDGDVCFCLASGSGVEGRFDPLLVGSLAASLVTDAIRAAVRR